MSLALRLAEQGLYSTQPNPRVGCVIVKNNQIIGQGAHLKAGDPHAEVFALREAGALAKGADVYVTLEPCSHHGLTPPCVDALISADVKRVIVAMQDPNPLVAGNGIKRLKVNGIEVFLGLMEPEAMALNIGFISRMTQHKPYVRCKLAASLDGRTALKNGKSQWISSEESRLDVQHWRARSCAIITGIGTVLADNPSMNVRLDNVQRQPLRIIIDSQLQTPADCKMLKHQGVNAGLVLIVYVSDAQGNAAKLSQAGAELLHLPHASGRVVLQDLLLDLAKRGINEVLIEAGQRLSGAFLEAGLIDELILYFAPKLMGADARSMFAMSTLTSMQQVTDLHIEDIRQIGPDVCVRAKPLKLDQ